MPSRFSAAGTTSITGATCQSGRLVALDRMMGGSYTHHRHEGRKEFGPCRRPLWGGDGKVDGRAPIVGGEEVPMCSLCWHNWCAMYGSYRLLGLNAAAAYVDVKAAATLEILFIESRTDPRKAAPVPASFLDAMWGADPVSGDALAENDDLPYQNDSGDIEWR